MKHLICAGGLALALGLAGAVIAMWFLRALDHEPAVWHIDPRTAERSGKPNDFLVAPAGASHAEPDANPRIYPVSPEELLLKIAGIALEQPRTELVASEARRVTFVQSSSFFGFPDYISISTFEVEGGASLAIWSRAHFGYGDMGVNQARVEHWLEALENE